jgi:hypothetical protein
MKTTIELAREAGFDSSGTELTWESVICTEELKAFEAFVRADEREACAKVCENWTQTPETTGMELALCTTAIRNRGNT